MSDRPALLKAVVEGGTELAICRQLIAPHLHACGITLSPLLIGGRGGRKAFDVLTADVRRCAREAPGCYVTTLFDYYGLPSDWPNVSSIKARNTTGVDPAIRAEQIESAIEAHVRMDIPTDILWNGHFIPYIQLHELEALLFSGPKEMAEAFGRPELEKDFASIAAVCAGCENINDSSITAPSKRISTHFPGYRKGKSSMAHAPVILKNIGIERIMKACPRFAAWISRLERLAG